MRAFAALLDRLSTTPGWETKLTLIAHYLETSPDPDRGWGLAALAGALDIPRVTGGTAKALILERVDPELFALSHDYVGDITETVALLWPEPKALPPPPSLSEVVETSRLSPRKRLPDLLAGWLDGLDATGRWALLKLISGRSRVGDTTRLARTAFAHWADLDLAAVEEAWFSQTPPYPALFTWAMGGPAPDLTDHATFRPFMLASPLEETDRELLDLDAYAVEWIWDGIRVQLVSTGRETRIFSRDGEDITDGFPDLVAALDFQGALDGELLVLTPEGPPASFADRQKRLNHKTVSKAVMDKLPAHVRLHDILLDGAEDLRPLPFRARRARLETWYDRARRPRLDLSPLITVGDWPTLDRLRANVRAAGKDGLMLKRWESPYHGGRPKNEWIKARRAPLSVNCVLMYAQRGEGTESGIYSEFTFGVWKGETLVPVGKATPTVTETEMNRLIPWIRDHARERFGPVRAVDPSLVLEIAFDSVQTSPRHRAGLTMRFPRIKRIRWDKPAGEADHLETLTVLT